MAHAQDFLGRLLLQAQQLVAMNKPSMRDQFSMRNYMEKGVLVESEASFVYDKEDLITLRPGRDRSYVDAFVESMLKVFDCKPLQVSCFEHPLSSLHFQLFFLSFSCNGFSTPPTKTEKTDECICSGFFAHRYEKTASPFLKYHLRLLPHINPLTLTGNRP